MTPEQQESGLTMEGRILAVLEAELWERGNYVPDWPEDEAALYRSWSDRHSFTEATQQVRRLMLAKAARAVAREIEAES